MKRQSLCMLLACTLMGLIGYAQPTDSLHLNIEKAESIFLTNNLQLLAARYNVDIARADVITAGLYNNPNLSFASSVYNTETKKVGDIFNGTGQYTADLQQVILLAGKRNKQVKLAETNAQISESEFYDLMRTLRYTLRSDFYSIHFLLNSYNAYAQQIVSLQKLETNNEELRKKEAVTLKDVIRIQSLLYSLKAEQTGLMNQINDLQAEVQLLLGSNKQFIVPEIADNAGTAARPPLLTLVDSAYANRYDLKASNQQVLYSQQDYSLQKAMAVPDLTLGAHFDKRGDYVNNSNLLSAAIDLPFFNRNQGRIKAAKIAIEQSKALQSQQTLQVENEVQTAWLKTVNTEKALQAINPQFRTDFEKLLVGITDNFQKKNISLLEFADFNDSYKQNILQMNQLENDRMQAIEALNYAIGKPLIN